MGYSIDVALHTKVWASSTGTYVVVDVWVVAVVEKCPLVNLLGLLGTVELQQDIATVDVGLSIVSSHADGLPVQQVGLLQPSLILRYQVRQVEENVEMVGSDASLVRLSRLCFRK